MNIFSTIIDLIALILTMVSGIKIGLRKKPVEHMPDSFAADATSIRALKPMSLNAFHLSAKSKRELIGVHPNLVAVVKRAILITDMDFVVYDGKRSAKEQNRHYKNGVSQLDGYKKKSYHQSGNAVDLVPYIKGRENHGDWNNYYHVAEAMVKAANELGVAESIRWGGVWDRRLHQLPSDAMGLKRALGGYSKRRKGKPFLDGPHWEWRA